MIKKKLMSSSGLKAYKQRKEYDKEFLKIQSSIVDDSTHEIELKLKENKIAWHNFKQLAKSHKKQYILWISNAKKDETKQKRIFEAIELLKHNKKLGMK